MALVAISIKLDRIDEGLLYKAQDGSYWLSCVCVFETDAKGRTIVAQSIPKERYAAGENRPQVGYWREIGGKPKPPAREGKGFDLARFKACPAHKPAPGANPRMARKGPRRSRLTAQTHNARRRQQITCTASMNPAFDMDADSRTLTKEEQWEQPDREAVIRDNPLLECCQRHGLQLKRDGAAKPLQVPVSASPRKDPELHDLRGPGPLLLFWLRQEGQRHRSARGAQGRVRHGGVMRSSRDRISWSKESWLGETDGGKEQHCSVPIWQRGVIRPVQGPGKGPQARRLAALRGAHTSGDRDSRHASRTFARGCLHCRGARFAFVRGLPGRPGLDCQRFAAQKRASSTAGRSTLGAHRRQEGVDAARERGSLADRAARGFILSGNCLVEGGPDLLAAFHLAWCDGVEERVAAAAMMGASNRIPEDAFRYFRRQAGTNLSAP